MGQTTKYVWIEAKDGSPAYYQGYDDVGNKTKTQPDYSQKGNVRKFGQLSVVDMDAIAGQSYGAGILNAKDFLTPEGVPISPDDAVAKWKELYPDTELDNTEIMAKVKKEMPQYGGVDEKDKQFAKQGLKQDMYGLQKGAAQAGQQMSNAYGSGMGSSIRSGIGSQKKVAQGFQQAEQSYEQDMYGLQKTAISDFETDLAGFAESFKQGGRVPKKKEKTFLDLLASIPSAGGN